MAQCYGGRWQIVDAAPLGEGGQSRVFRVRDLTGPPEETFALKRVLNPARHERFRREIEAGKLLSHPNIIRVVDHSALDDTSRSQDKQYIVMPIAAAGDLGRPERYSLYTGAIDAVILVAKQLADALAAAHTAGVIHRDVKPQNILFTGNGHEVWVADFGICLIREVSRLTQDREVAGPRTFIAPELEEGGGSLDVTPAADVYSLGKVIYFMLSGGIELPRERLNEAQYAAVFEGGERHRLLQLLLRRMICPVHERIGDMGDVLSELARIDEWEKTARSLPISTAALAGFDRLREQAFKNQKINEANLATREQQDRARRSVTDTFEPWLTGELGTLGAAISSDALPVEVKKSTQVQNNNFKLQIGDEIFIGLISIELLVREVNGLPNRNHHLQFILCEHRRVRVIAGHNPQPLPFRDLSLALVPFYRQTVGNASPHLSPLMGYLRRRNTIGQVVGHIRPQQILHGNMPRVAYSQGSHVSQTFDMNLSQYLQFDASDWPANREKLRESVSEAIEIFIAFIGRGANAVGA